MEVEQSTEKRSPIKETLAQLEVLQEQQRKVEER